MADAADVADAAQERADRLNRIRTHVATVVVPALVEKHNLAKEVHTNARKRWNRDENQALLDMYIDRVGAEEMSVRLLRSKKAVAFQLQKILASILFADPQHVAALATLAHGVGRTSDELRKDLLVDHGGMLLRVAPQLPPVNE